MNRSFVIFVGCLILVLYVSIKTFPLKVISYDKIPKVGQTFDEYSFAWTGKSFLTGGMPVSWTTNLGVYKNKYSSGNLKGFILSSGETPIPKPLITTLTFDYGLGDRYIDLVQPYFDHPPLAGVVYSLGIPSDTKSLLDIKPADFRLMTRYLSLLTALLIFGVGTILYSPVVGTMAMIFYSTLPSTLLPARMTMAENVTTPLFLLTVLLVAIGNRYKKTFLFILAGIVAGLTMLAKFSGVSALIVGLLLCWHWKIKRQHILIFLGLAIFVGLLYIGYGLYLSPGLFFNVIFSQAGRGGWGAIVFFQAIERVFFTGMPLDGWWTGGFIVLMYLAALPKHRPLSLMALGYTLVAVGLGGDNNTWYFFPLGVFFVLGYGVLIKEVYEKPSIINLSLLLLFPVLSSLYWGYYRLHLDSNLSWPIRILIGGFAASGLFMEKFIQKWPWVKVLWLILLVLLIHRLYLWNFRSMQYILLEWGKLPHPLMWGIKV